MKLDYRFDASPEALGLSKRETEVLSWVIQGKRDSGGRGTDNHMIQHLDLQEPGAFGEPASQAGICLGRRRIPRWLVVLKDQAKLSLFSKLAVRKEEPRELCAASDRIQG
jgi:hypothetical protein